MIISPREVAPGCTRSHEIMRDCARLHAPDVEEADGQQVGAGVAIDAQLRADAREEQALLPKSDKVVSASVETMHD
eukprot:5826326-Pleurochrysis_carterae.AAC.1